MDAVIELHYGALYRYALALSGSQSAACDLTQETFYLWIRHRGGIRDESKTKGWLFTTLYREFLKTRRRSARFPELEISEAEGDLPQIQPGEVEKMDSDLVMQALQEVDERYRSSLSLFYLERMTYSEIAETLETPIGTVMSRISRGRSQLRALLSSRMTAEDRKVTVFRRTGTEPD
jgi:RNA polymerase sigma-70 factor, ECF subfamily